MLIIQEKTHLRDNIYNLEREEDPNNNLKKNPRIYFEKLTYLNINTIIFVCKINSKQYLHSLDLEQIFAKHMNLAMVNSDNIWGAIQCEDWS